MVTGKCGKREKAHGRCTGKPPETLTPGGGLIQHFAAQAKGSSWLVSPVPEWGTLALLKMPAQFLVHSLVFSLVNCQSS